MVRRNISNDFVKGAFVLTFASVVGKILSALYRIPLQNLTGDVGFYVYQQVYPLLGIAAVLGFYAFPSAISKLVIEWKDEKREISWKGLILPIWFVLMIFHGIIFLVFFFFSHPLATMLGHPQLAHSYQWTGAAFLCIPFLALVRGIFQGNLEMVPIAVSQVTEQLVRVSIIILVSIFVYFQVIPIYELGKYAAIASLLGFVTAFLMLMIYMLRSESFSVEKDSIPWKSFVRTLLLLGFAVGLNHMALLFIQLADTFTFVPELMQYGLTQMEAMESKGVLDRGQPLIQFGMVLASSLALTMIPAISKEKLKYQPYVTSAFRLCLYVSSGATVGLIMIFPETNLLLFQDTDGTRDLQILVLAIFFSSLAVTGSSILQGMGFLKRTAVFIVITFFVKILCNKLFIPFLGVTGASVATVSSLFLWFIMVWISLKRELSPLVFVQRKQVLALIAANGVMGLYIFMVKPFADFFMAARWELAIFIFFIVLSGALLYLMVLMRLRAFTKEEQQLLPFSKYLSKF